MPMKKTAIERCHFFKFYLENYNFKEIQNYLSDEQ